MKKNSKRPEVRRNELIEVASKLFAEKGYEAVSVRDILDQVNGAPGMFYYYFKSKQEIYIAVMEEYISKRLERKCKVLEDENVLFEEKVKTFRNMITEDIDGYLERFKPQADTSISDSSYKIWELVQMLSRMIKPYSHLILQGIKEGKVKNNIGITEENAEAFAQFVLYGSWGMIYNNKFTGNGNQYEANDVLDITNKLFY
ncbi:MAG: TetR/AcrR family transcriptional regulator [Lachnospiraceae bacterium]